MTFIALLSREHETLPREELEAVLAAESPDHTIDRQMGDAVFFDAGTLPFDRLAMTTEVSELLHETSVDDISGLGGRIGAFDGSFAVRCSELYGGSVDAGLEERLGDIVQRETGQPVDLEGPDTMFRGYVADGRLFFCRQVADIDTGAFERRRSHLRPFSSPVSLHPKLARVLVNLSGVKAGDRLLDPLCGTGGILIEAGMVGCELYGVDVQQEMVDGCGENLEAFDLDATLWQGDVRDLSSVVEGKFDAVVSDLPYGRASLSEGGQEDLVRAFLREAGKCCTGRVVFMHNSEDVLGLDPMFERYVHSSLTRYGYVLEASEIAQRF